MKKPLKVLIVCSGNKGRINPFIADQVIALERSGFVTQVFLIKGKGIVGYLSNLRKLITTIKDSQANIIHAHYGLSGLLANMQRRIPVVVTYHGSDVEVNKNYWLSRISARLSAYNIVVTHSFVAKLRLTKKFATIPCGIDPGIFYPISQQQARKQANLPLSGKLVLFTSRFDNPVKNFKLAKAAVDLLPGVILLELKNYSREETCVMMNAADCLLVTSFRETGPLVSKEAFACNLPVVSTRVGDLINLIEQSPGNFIAEADPKSIAEKLELVFTRSKRTDSRDKILAFDNKIIAKQITAVYNEVLHLGSGASLTTAVKRWKGNTKLID